MQALYHYPKQARFGQPVAKAKIYQHAKPNRATRDYFVSQVDKIIWQYKLAPETIILPAQSAVPEIQIFDIFLKTDQLNIAVLRSIDKAIAFPVIYQLHYANRIQVIAAYKRPSDVDASQWVISDYYAGVWQPIDTERIELPVALDLAGLYEQLLRQLLPYPQRAGEMLKTQIERLGHIRSKQSDYRKMESRLQKERQFNRKVELNAQLRHLKSQLETLSS
jgi:hypothetical protein